MKIVTILAIAVFVLATGHVVVTRPAHSEPSEEPRVGVSSAKLDALLKERRDTFRQLLKMARARHRLGGATVESVIHASLQLLQAELEMAKGSGERIAIHKQMIELLRTLEKTAQQKFKAGAVRQDEVLKAKADRLQAEIRLLREQSSK